MSTTEPNSTTPSTGVPLLEAKHIIKRFGGVTAVNDVSVTIQEGEIHGLVGENGAGKSTLMRVLAGILTPTDGEVLFDGTALRAGSTRAALNAGIALVHQELSLVPEMTVAENIMLGFTPTMGLGVTDRGRMRKVAQDALDQIHVQVDVDIPVARLSVALRQFVEIARAVARKPRVLILDEPTATLTPAETDYLLDMLKKLASQGIAIIYISHRIPEIFAICDRVTTLRDGEKIDTVAIDTIAPNELVDKMVGRELKKDLASHRDHVEFGDVVLDARGITAEGVNGVDLEVRAGQIVGLGGLVGAGRTELVRAIIGADPRSSGTATITVEGATHRLDTYHKAVSHGVAYIPEERRTDGLALTMTVTDNVSLPNRRRLAPNGVIQKGKVRSFATKMAEQVGLRPPNIDLDAGDFSGGNQQKIVFGKWVGREPKLIILDEPTRGVDVGAKTEIHRLVKEMADNGAAVVVVSSDLPELLELSDIIHVVRDGEIVGTLDGADADEKSVMSLAAGEAEMA